MKKKSATWVPPEGSLQLKDVEVGKIVYIIGTTTRLKIVSDQANWLPEGMEPIQKAWASGVLVQLLDSSGNPYSDNRSTPFVTVLHWLSTQEEFAAKCEGAFESKKPVNQTYDFGNFDNW